MEYVLTPRTNCWKYQFLNISPVNRAFFVHVDKRINKTLENLGFLAFPITNEVNLCIPDASKNGNFSLGSLHTWNSFLRHENTSFLGCSFQKRMVWSALYRWFSFKSNSWISVHVIDRSIHYTDIEWKYIYSTKAILWTTVNLPLVDFNREYFYHKDVEEDCNTK